jgi:formamidopyrimidine-DNA glycosylase
LALINAAVRDDLARKVGAALWIRGEAEMLKLPDVEGFKDVLVKSALRKTIDRVVVNDGRILGKLSARTFASRLQGTRLVAARRHGKHLMANIDGGGWLTLHFGMTGALQFVWKLDDKPPFTRVRLDFANDGCLAYTNKRMIGRVGLVEDAADFITAQKLGPDALDRRFRLPCLASSAM